MTSTQPSLAQLDKNFALPTSAEGMTWYDIRALGVEGQGWKDVESTYDRFPAKAKGVVRDPVWHLSQHSAGLCVRFVTDSPRVAAQWTVRSANLAMDHMPSTGVSGLDLYAWDEAGKRWRFSGVGRLKETNAKATLLSASNPAGPRHFLLYLPLYNGVSEVRVGINDGATITKAPAYPVSDQRPIVFYGTSIVQGGCASRPGMVHTAILHRRLNRPVINLGFSGNAKSEPEVADLLAELDPCAYVLDPLPNMSEDEVRQRIVPLVNTLRLARPMIPIILVGNIHYTDGWINTGRGDRARKSNAALLECFQQLQAQGVPNISLIPGEKMLDAAGEGTVDGTHPTDVGFTAMADAQEPVLRQVLG
jgi:lysophospholipase L1-like esterase